LLVFILFWGFAGLLKALGGPAFLLLYITWQTISLPFAAAQFTTFLRGNPFPFFLLFLLI
jgi:hypothetical protein